MPGERLHRTLFAEHFRVMGRKKFYESVDEMQKDLDAYFVTYNTKRPHQGRNMNGRTPTDVFVAGLPKPKNRKEEKPKKPLKLSQPRSGECQAITISVHTNIQTGPVSGGRS